MGGQFRGNREVHPLNSEYLVVLLFYYFLLETQGRSEIVFLKWIASSAGLSRIVQVIQFYSISSLSAVEPESGAQSSGAGCTIQWDNGSSIWCLRIFTGDRRSGHQSDIMRLRHCCWGITDRKRGRSHSTSILPLGQVIKIGRVL